MKAVVAAFNQEKALVGAFSVITNLQMQLFEAPTCTGDLGGCGPGAGSVFIMLLHSAAALCKRKISDMQKKNI